MYFCFELIKHFDDFLHYFGRLILPYWVSIILVPLKAVTRLSCHASGFSTTVTWKNVRSKEERRDRSWIFRNITRFDNRGYACYASNTYGSVNKNIYVNVKCKFCLYRIDFCNFSCNFSSFIQVKSFNQKEKCATLFSLYSTDPLKNMCLVTYFLIDLLT